MNAARRTRIRKIATELSGFQKSLETIADSEQEILDGRSEAFLDSERGDEAQEAIDFVEAASLSVKEAIRYLTKVCGPIA